MIGKKINNYRIEKLLGEGGMGNVYFARHESMDRLVAIKAILPELIANEDVKKRFLIEASTMSKLQHENIVTLYDYVSNEDGLFLIMEFVDGIQLDVYMKNLGKPIEEELAIEFTKQIVSACNHAHERDVVHRDIKPPNVMITADGNVKILDFGIAKIMNDEVNNLTKTGTQLGTVYYMAPEQVKGEEITPSTDIYSIGVSLYQMVTGVRPYSDMTTEYQIYDRIVKEDLPDPRTLNSALSEYVTKVISKATRKATSDRFSNCKDFLEVLNNQENLRAKYSGEKQPIAVPLQKQVEQKPKLVVKEKTAATIIKDPIQPATKKNGLATAALVVGIVSIVSIFIPFLAIPFGIVAIILGVVAKNKIKADPGLANSSGAATGGLITGIIGTIIGIILIGMYFITINDAYYNDPYYNDYDVDYDGAENYEVNEELPGKYPEASMRELDDGDVYNLSYEDLEIMRNEIYARHGYEFTTSKMQAYFLSQEWYIPLYSNVEGLLTQLEHENIRLIQSYEYE